MNFERFDFPPPLIQNALSQIPQRLSNQYNMFNCESFSHDSDGRYDGYGIRDQHASNSSYDWNESNMEEFAIPTDVSNEMRDPSISDPVFSYNWTPVYDSTPEHENEFLNFNRRKAEVRVSNIVEPNDQRHETTSMRPTSSGQKGRAKQDKSETLAVDKTFECRACGKQFEKQKLLNRHKRIHSKEKFVCEVCGKRFWEKGGYEAHYLSHGSFKCKVCDCRFRRKKTLNLHMRSHRGEKLFMCEVCGKEFWEKENFDSHYRSHTGFKCGECGCQFRRQKDLIAHIRMHARDHQFQWEYEKQFPGIVFENRNRMHTFESIFKCEKCGKEFPGQKSLKKHIKTHDGEKLLRCKLCRKPFHLEDIILFKEHCELHDSEIS